MYQNKRDISSLRAAYYFDTVIKKDKNRRFVNIDDNYKIKTSRSGRFELMCDLSDTNLIGTLLYRSFLYGLVYSAWPASNITVGLVPYLPKAAVSAYSRKKNTLKKARHKTTDRTDIIRPLNIPQSLLIQLKICF